MSRVPATLGIIWASLVLQAAPTSAQEQINVAVMGFGGATGAKVRQSVVSAMGSRKEINIVPLSDVRSAEDRLGVRVNDAAGAKKVGHEQRIVGFIDGNAGRRGRAWTASIELRSGTTGEVLKTAFFRDRTLSGLQRKVRFGTWGAIRASLQSAAGQDFTASDKDPETPAEEEESGEREETDEWEETGEWEDAEDWEGDESADDDDANEEWSDVSEQASSDTATPSARMPLMRASLGLTGVMRSLSFSYQAGDLSPSSFTTLGLGFRFEMHPIENLGLVLRGDTIFPISSGDADSDLTYPTSSGHVLAAAHGRFELDGAVLGVTLGLEHRETIIAAAGPATPQDSTAAPVPSVSYDALRLGGDVRLALAPVLLEFHGALLIPLGVGSIDAPVWMRDAGGFGFNLGAELDLPIDDPWSLIAGVDFDVFLLSAGSVNSTDLFPDASASDLYLSLYVGAGLTL